MNNRWVKAVLAVAIVWAVLIAGKSFLSNAGSWFLPHFINVGDNGQRAERVEEKSFPATDLNAVEVLSRNGSIKLVGSDSDQVTVTAKYRAEAGSQQAADEKLAKMQTVYSTDNGRLQVKAEFGVSSISNMQITYELTVPRDLLVRVDTSNGGITADGLAGRLELATSNGGIDVVADGGPQELQATSSNGNITVSGNPSGGYYNLRTSNGSVEVTLPASLGIELDASTQNGSLNIGEGQWSISGGKISGKDVTATRGDGALKLTMKTSNGHIKLITK